jgi:hypothetical protein
MGLGLKRRRWKALHMLRRHKGEGALESVALQLTLEDPRCVKLLAGQGLGLEMQAKLQRLQDSGFHNRRRNLSALAKYGDVDETLSALNKRREKKANRGKHWTRHRGIARKGLADSSSSSSSDSESRQAKIEHRREVKAGMVEVEKARVPLSRYTHASHTRA